MNERGERLKELETKFADLAAGSSSFLDKAKALNEREVSRKHRLLSRIKR
jgi:hypothetical protein